MQTIRVIATKAQAGMNHLKLLGHCCIAALSLNVLRALMGPVLCTVLIPQAQISTLQA